MIGSMMENLNRFQLLISLTGFGIDLEYKELPSRSSAPAASHYAPRVLSRLFDDSMQRCLTACSHAPRRNDWKTCVIDFNLARGSPSALIKLFDSSRVPVVNYALWTHPDISLSIDAERVGCVIFPSFSSYGSHDARFTVATIVAMSAKTRIE